MLKDSDCPGQCISIRDAWNRDHPHLPAEFKDGGYAYTELGEGASSYCANCQGYVCTKCGKERSDKFMGLCHSCALQTEWDHWGYREHPNWLGETSPEDLADYKTIASWPNPQKHLARIVGEIASASGQNTDTVKTLINRELGVGIGREGYEGRIRQEIVLAPSWRDGLLQADGEP
ncbi:hypothetical protein ACFV0C_22475 [Streptomyces sp. NPDC059568]|uniref:hypothetical protein n=1 Tax=Streptomyces sp. NPDC059568 TaxID=3346868 RepID=UPI0036CA8D2B